MRYHIIENIITNSFSYSNRIKTYFVGLIILFVSCCGVAQNNNKKELTAADYPLWSYLTVEKLSENAKWVSYVNYYENGKDTLFVKSSKGTITYSFAGESKGSFIDDTWFCSMNPKGNLTVTNLVTAKRETIQGVIKYDLRANCKELIILKKGNDKENIFEVKNLSTNQSIVLDSIENYSYNSIADAVVLTSKSKGNSTVILLNLKNKVKTLVTNSSELLDNTDFVWQDDGKSFAFLQQSASDVEKNNKSSVFYYVIPESKLYIFDPKEQNKFPLDMKIISSSFANLNISKDGKRIFFGLQKGVVPPNASQVQVWNSQDKFLYPAKIQIDDWNNKTKVAVWWPQENRYSQITDNEFPKMMLSGDQKQAFVYNSQHYEPQANYDAPLDIYTANLETGEKKVLLQNQLGNEGGTSVSMYEKHIVYFKSKHWWVYNMESGLHKNLTKDLDVAFSDQKSDWAEESPPFGNPGWTAKDNTVFIYDQYDIWCIAIDGSKAFRLTNGRKNKVVYRIIISPENQLSKMNYDAGNYKASFEPKETLIIKTQSLDHTGYCFWNKKTGLKTLLDKKMRTSQVITTTSRNGFVYVEENFNTPPKLVFKETKESNEKILFQSNPQHFKYNWGYSKLIEYTNAKGSILNGVLCYPANYNPKTKYPMIVYVYEKLSKELYNYINPSHNNPTGFNVANLTSKGYFVLLPDIDYEVGNPGASATDCVIAATKKIIANEPIDPARIGLIGHSYGGYETNYIITQSTMFATAVAGAAINDFVSGYLWTSPSYQKPNFWHYEFGQLRIGKSLYEDYQGYLKNSPIYYADKVTTPLLSWSGEQDGQVHYYQSLQFYLALRRLGKTNTMLIYPDEGHVLSNRSHQQDLTQKIEAWFDYYLKGISKN
ncbi:S9 family peptidase [Flavobacterium turcicum]|uniref:S9 family peptidase n=1 Tax=Flavobacterium turcicum TaxID=2764718 RepID=A0ABR7JEA2_9FLAO|nr:prolyl oligopeptidase family serine peptidase [Flavobacterium turcicum]MBC5862836.1 S9 family peptidase [Flavobacterium turcicum]NHL01568.1 S9 family peptidase [Flavobacterium turcicum]